MVSKGERWQQPSLTHYCAPPKGCQCCHALGHCSREDLLVEHKNRKQKQTQCPSSPPELHGKPHLSSGCLCTIPHVWPHFQDRANWSHGSCHPITCWEQLEADFLFWIWQARAKLRPSGCLAPLLAGQRQRKQGKGRQQG